MSKPEIATGDYALANQLWAVANTGWYTGDHASLARFGSRREIIGRTNPELTIRLLLSRDKMHHSVGWWRNADYEYCWHLSMSAWDRARRPARTGQMMDPEDIPPEEERYWSFAFFPRDYDKVWHEPGGTDPRLTPAEKMKHRHFSHLRVFLHPLTMHPFIPEGEVYHLTKWIPGLTPEKVDR